VTRLAEYTCHCAADCGQLIRRGEPYEKIVGGGSQQTAYLHPECVDAYERLLAAAKVGPVRNAPQSARATELGEFECERCGKYHAGRSRGGTPEPCRAITPDGTCGGRLVPVGEDLPTTTPETDRATAPAAGSRSFAGTGEPARSRSGGRPRRLDPQPGLGDEAAGPAGEIEERGSAPRERNAPSGEDDP
jgi:hypothetical protein